MPTFLARKYRRGRPGPTERGIGVCILLLLVVIVAAFITTSGMIARESDEKSVARVQTRFVGLGDGTIQPPAKIEVYTDNLYEKINGKEGAYRAFHVVELKFGRYLDTAAGDEYDVYVYDMALPVNAFGIYMVERNRSARVLQVGRGGYLSGTSVFFWKGKYYVNVLGSADSGEAITGNSKKIAKAIADTITDDGGQFWADTLLPAENRLPHSFSYQATNALAYDFLSQMFIADYAIGGESFQMFIIKTASDGAARVLLDKYAQEAVKYDKILSRTKEKGGEMLLADSMGVYSAIFCKGVYFGGVTECENKDLAAKKAADFRDSL